VQLGLNPIFRIARNPLPWLDEMLNAVEHANFFENRATEYSKAATAGSWEEAFEEGSSERNLVSPGGDPAHSAPTH
jgi:ribonucleoside-diphosphate reductase beta chain